MSARGSSGTERSIPAASVRADHWPVAGRAVALALSVLILTIPARDLLAIAQGATPIAPLGVDLTLYRDAASRWLASGEFYPAWQLSGHYAIWAGGGPILYPPVTLLLLVPFTMLPAVLWWAIPAAMVGWSIWRLHPAPWAWPLMAFCLAWPPSVVRIFGGNPVMWAVAFLAVGCVTAGPAVFVLLKPSLAPFALMGVRSRRWWIAAGILAAASLPFGAMWLDWLRTITNSDGSLAYSLQESPLLLLPLVAWASRRPDPALAVMAG